MKYTLLLLISLLLGCSSNKGTTETGSIPVINLSENVSAISSLPLSETASKIDVVPLETLDESVLGGIWQLQVTANDIWIRHYKDGRIYRFSRTGKYLNKVGKIGQGNEEYIQCSDFFVDEEQKEVYIVSTYNGVYVYNFDGIYKRKPTKQSTIGSQSNSMFSAIKEQYIIYHQSIFLSQNLPLLKDINSPKDSLWSIALVDSIFQKEKIFKNPSHIGKEELIMENRSKPTSYNAVNYWTENQTQIDICNNELTLKYPDTDTIYQYDEGKEEFIPQYSIFTNEEKGEYGFTHLWIKDRKAFDYFNISGYYPAKDFIYLIGNKGEEIYTFCYGKKDGSVRQQTRKGKITERKLPWFSQPHRRLDCPLILRNDLSGGEFTIDYRSSGKYWIDVLEPGTENWIDIERIKTSTVIDEAKKNEFIKVLEGVNEDSNPILLIATLK